MTMLYKLETFEGPLDLLLHLIDQAEVDIYDIPISQITDQYMKYIESMQDLQLDITSEFLVMAATLLSIKSRMLLPKPPIVDLELEGMDEDYDPRAELIQKLIEYRKYKGIAEHLRDRELERSLIFSRMPEDLTPFLPETKENPLKGLHVADLVLAFQKALKRSVKRSAVSRIKRDEVSVKDRIFEVLRMLEQHQGKILFSKLIHQELSRHEIVVTFLALLELMKMKKIKCYQYSLFEDIVIEANEGGYTGGIPTDEIDY
jgi:segregation and condensation protein A